jgi:hypothetical protein
MAKKTNPPKKKSSPVGPYKAAPKSDKSVGVRRMTAPKDKGGSQFLPKGIPAGSKKNVPGKVSEISKLDAQIRMKESQNKKYLASEQEKRGNMAAAKTLRSQATRDSLNAVNIMKPKRK